MSWIGIAGVVALLCVANLVYLSWYFRWEHEQTRGLAYFGRTAAGRRALKRRIRFLSRPVIPLARMLASLNRGPTMPTFEYEGVCGPPKVSGPEVFARAKTYVPRREDVFVVTQMRCGTTWMQQLVYETVCRGKGDLSDAGHRHLYALSPWIDAYNSVSMDDAPIVGDRPTRLIKTHLPAVLCPFGAEARYIYVTRDPVSCFASIVDYNRSLLGPLAPPADKLAAWFCSDRMYWRPWPAHVEGWWQRAEAHDNVLFVRFEDMSRDFTSVQLQVERFLDCTLSAAERARVAEKCSFRYMKDHEEVFEMAPPTMFSVAGGKFLASGKASRHDDVTPAVRAQIVAYCRRSLRAGAYPIDRFYPEPTIQQALN